MNTHNEYISYWLRRFLLEYATTVRNLSKNTIVTRSSCCFRTCQK